MGAMPETTICSLKAERKRCGARFLALLPAQTYTAGSSFRGQLGMAIAPADTSALLKKDEEL